MSAEAVSERKRSFRHAPQEGHYEDPQQQSPAVAIHGLVTRLGNETVHDGLELELRRGEILGLVGASGSGKSILLRVLLGLVQPQHGEVRIFGIDSVSASSDERRRLSALWGVVFQENALFSTLTVRENIALVLRKHTDMADDLIDQISNVKITMAELPPESAIQYPAELSGGMRKRAALARALALDPRLLLLDEPTAGLDPIVAAKLDALIAGLRNALGITVLLITHDLDTMYRVCDRVAVLADKKIVAIGPFRELEKSSHPWVKAYFQGPRAHAAAQAAQRVQQEASPTTSPPKERTL